MVRPAKAWISLLVALILADTSSLALASNPFFLNRIIRRIRRGGEQAIQLDPSSGNDDIGTVTSTKLYAASVPGQTGSLNVEDAIDVSWFGLVC